MATDNVVDIKTLSAAQLQVLGEQFEEELTSLTDNFTKLQSAVSRFYSSGMTLEALAAETEGTPMMVPLTESLYAPGLLGATDKVLLDIGTGYFVEVRA
jgi:prefoldin alpha subunit